MRMEPGVCNFHEILCKAFEEDNVNSNFQRYYTTEILECINSLHKYEIIHRDIKPGNFVLSPLTGRLKLIDLGTSRKLTSEGSYVTQLTDLRCSPNYVSPEFVSDMSRLKLLPGVYTFKAQIDTRTDVWSAGVVFYKMANHGVSPFEHLKDHLDKACEISNLSKAVPLLDSTGQNPVFDDFLAKCLSKDISSRLSVPELLSHPYLAWLFNN